ncbi:MAG: pilus assembly protein [Rhodospirillales bacterium]|nr:MAG: pilus assembly protein [Rhodospirillales bacterium]
MVAIARIAGMTRLARCLAGDRRGNAMIEFALLAPVMIGIALAGFELGRYALLHLKTFNAASSMADLASRDKALTQSALDSLFAAVGQIVAPFDMASQGRLILTGVSADTDDNPRVFWQAEGGGTLVAASEVGSAGAAAALPGSISVRANETVVVAEVFYRFEPVFVTWMDPVTIRQDAYYRPRLGTLRSID